MAIFKGGKDRSDSFTGTDADDGFVFAAADLYSNDTIVGGGGAGIDTLVFTTAARLAAARLSHVNGIERIELAAGQNAITLNDALVGSASGHRVTVIGNMGTDAIDASSLTGGNAIDVLARGGTDSLKGGAGSDSFSFSVKDLAEGDRVDGGAGVDTIRLLDGGGVTAAKFAGVRSIEAIALSDQSTRIWLTAAMFTDASTQSPTVRGGAGDDLIDARGLHGRSGLSGMLTIYGGAGNDTIYGTLRPEDDQEVMSNTIIGGAGADTMIGSEDFNGTSFVINEGDFAAGESILGRTGGDYLSVRGSADMTTGRVTGIRYLDMGPGESGEPNTLILGDDEVENLVYLSGAGSLIIRVGADHGVAFGPTNFGAPSLSVTIQGSDAADTIGGGSTYQLTVHGNAGNDVIGSQGKVYGDAGNDLIAYNSSAQLIDGGNGSDTLRTPGDNTVVVRLGEAADQTANDNVVVRNMENVDFSRNNLGLDYATLDCIGSDGANRLVGGSRNDTISGAGGDDTIGGGNGADTLTGGAGADRFFWTALGGSDTITDYTPGEDQLVFARKDPSGNVAYDFAGGKFDTLVTAATATTNIAGADLVVYTAGELNSLDDVARFLRDNGTGSVGEGIFIAGQTKADHTVLYYVSDASLHNAMFGTIADLGAVAPTALTVSDFAFI